MLLDPLEPRLRLIAHSAPFFALALRGGAGAIPSALSVNIAFGVFPSTSTIPSAFHSVTYLLMSLWFTPVAFSIAVTPAVPSAMAS